MTDRTWTGRTGGRPPSGSVACSPTRPSRTGTPSRTRENRSVQVNSIRCGRLSAYSGTSNRVTLISVRDPAVAVVCSQRSGLKPRFVEEVADHRHPLGRHNHVGGGPLDRLPEHHPALDDLYLCLGRGAAVARSPPSIAATSSPCFSSSTWTSASAWNTGHRERVENPATPPKGW